jgi:hypothetical protein
MISKNFMKNKICSNLIKKKIQNSLETDIEKQYEAISTFFYFLFFYIIEYREFNIKKPEVEEILSCLNLHGETPFDNLYSMVMKMIKTEVSWYFNLDHFEKKIYYLSIIDFKTIGVRSEDIKILYQKTYFLSQSLQIPEYQKVLEMIYQKKISTFIIKQKETEI